MNLPVILDEVPKSTEALTPAPNKQDTVGFAAAALRFVERRWALLGAYLLALGYLYLVQYAWSEHIPLRIHLGAMTSLLPWLLLNLALVTVVMVGSVASIVSVGGLRLKNGAPLSTVIWAPRGAAREIKVSALWAWLHVVAIPLLLAACMAIGMVLLESFDEMGALLAYFVVPLLTGLVLTLRALRLRGVPAGLRFSMQYLLQTATALLMFGLHVFGFGINLLRHISARSDTAVSVGLIAYACVVVAYQLRSLRIDLG